MRESIEGHLNSKREKILDFYLSKKCIYGFKNGNELSRRLPNYKRRPEHSVNQHHEFLVTHWKKNAFKNNELRKKEIQLGSDSDNICPTQSKRQVTRQ
jgi:hypothetical protein